MSIPAPVKIGSSRLIKDSHIAELDGIRGIAILLVLLFHLSVNAPVPLPVALGFPLSIGWSGVDLFFVLSGFLITGILVDTRLSENYFSSFYVRRVLRIFPLYLSFLFAYFCVALPVAHRLGYLRSLDSAWQIWYWFHLSNFVTAFGNDLKMPGQHFWSLAIEEQFYLVWPLIVAFVRPSRLVFVCCALIAIPFGLRIAFVHQNYSDQFLYRLTPFRVDTLAVGCLAALVVRNRKWLEAARHALPFVLVSCVAVLSAVLLLTRTAMPHTELMSTVGYSSLAFAYGAFVLYGYCASGSSGNMAALLRTKALRRLGKYSYAIYVLHVLVVMGQAGLLKLASRRLPYTWNVVLSIVSLLSGVLISYLLAVMSWNLLEKHFLRLKKNFSANRVSAAAV